MSMPLNVDIAFIIEIIKDDDDAKPEPWDGMSAVKVTVIGVLILKYSNTILISSFLISDMLSTNSVFKY